MIFDYDDLKKDDESGSGLDYDNEFTKAKSFLQKSSNLTGDNVYDHLTEVLNKILAERPENVIDFFEEYSRKVKEQRFIPQTDHLEDIYVPPLRYELANKFMPFLRPPPPEEASTVDPEDLEIADMSANNMLQLLYYFEQAGIGLPREEMYAIMLSMRKLIKTEPIASIRFWGKVYGTFKNYIVVETELREEEYLKQIEEIEKHKQEQEMELQAAMQADDIARLAEIGDIELEAEEPLKTDKKVPRPLPPAPVSHFEEPPVPPPEFPGVGVNKKVYYVCNDACDPWVRLPDVKPTYIVVARQIYKSFTGNLDQEVITYPDFPGTERELLRAQIARISAGTQISPLGFYSFGGDEGEEEEEEEEEEEDEEGGGAKVKTTYKENKRYEPVPMRDLTDGSMAFWVHHTLYILPQGRTTWWNPYPQVGGEEEELGEEEEEEKPKGPKLEPEVGPPLLTPLSEDATLEAVPPWSVRTSSRLLTDYALAIVRSNLWPGAYCFSTQGKLFQNVYLGNGLKYIAYNFTPLPLPPIQAEYPIGPEIMEISDPTGAQEEEWRIAHLPKEKPTKLGEEEQAEEEEEEEEEEEDD